MKHPLVSVNIRTYNSDKTLEETLQSVRNQSYKNIEIVVSDGFSTDRSVKIAKKYGARINYAQKLGDARRQNYEQSRGTYIFSLDSDQILDPGLVETCVKLCESQQLDAITISERSKIRKGTLIEKLIAFDKWVIDANKDADVVFGTACPRFFRKSALATIAWHDELAVFDDTILYDELTKRGAKISYVSSTSIYHYEVTSWLVFFKKFFRYGKGYFGALKERPKTIAAHSLPRRSYFSAVAFTKPHYILGLLLLYVVKVAAAGCGATSYLLGEFRKKLVNIGDWPYYSALDRCLRDVDSVLDVGCGSNSPIAKIKKRFRSVGIDIHKPSIEKSEEQHIHTEHRVGDILRLENYFKQNSFDAVIALDVVEHFAKRDALRLIHSMENIARKKVIIFTPYGFTKQHAYDGNPYQEHKSGWYIHEFKKMGYEVHGMRGFRFIRGGEGGTTIRFKPWFVWGILSFLSQPVAYFVPQWACQLLAVKHK